MIHLYIKTHNKTGLKYFGKTTKKDPYRYPGSGKYWTKHLQKHGKDYSTEILATFEDVELCKQFALKFSIENDIVNSISWANLRQENGMDGAPEGHPGHKFTDEQLQKISQTSKERWEDQEYRNKVHESQKKSWTEDRKQEQKERLTGKKRPEHSECMKGRKLSENHSWVSGDPRTEEHKKNISKSLLGKPKSDEHKKNLSKPKVKICRIEDRREMSVNSFTSWLKSLLVNEISI